MTQLKDFIDPKETDLVPAINRAIAAMGSRGRLEIPAGIFKINSTILLPPNVSLVGAGKNATYIITNGSFDGIIAASDSGYVHMGSIRGLTLHGKNTGLCGIRISHRQHGILDDVCVRSFLQQGIYIADSLMTSMRECLVMGCARPPFASVEVDNCTTYLWDKCRISGSQLGSQVGLRIDRTSNFEISRGNIESCGVQIVLGSKAPVSVNGENPDWTGPGLIQGLSMENPCNGADCYVACGYGWKEGSDGAVRDISFRNCSMMPSGAFGVVYGMKFRSTRTVDVTKCVCGPLPSMKAYLLWDGNSNRLWSTGVNNMLDRTIAFAMQNGAVTPAGPGIPYAAGK